MKSAPQTCSVSAPGAKRYVRACPGQRQDFCTHPGGQAVPPMPLFKRTHPWLLYTCTPIYTPLHRYIPVSVTRYAITFVSTHPRCNDVHCTMETKNQKLNKDKLQKTKSSPETTNQADLSYEQTFAAHTPFDYHTEPRLVFTSNFPCSPPPPRHSSIYFMLWLFVLPSAFCM